MEKILIVLLFLLGVHGLIAQKNLIRKVMALSLTNGSVIIAFTYLGSFPGTKAPILSGRDPSGAPLDIVDPLPQALMLTAIVIGICLTALALVLVHRLYQKYGTLDADEIDRLLRDEHG